jgi:two-component system, OmpR family, response regulator
MTILIVEDELKLIRELETFLSKELFSCDKAFNLKQAKEKLDKNIYDFILLDLGLPDGDGMEIINKIKKIKSEAAVIILTARGELTNKIVGLDAGADDYLPKPFALPELLARINAISRRKFGLKSSILEIGDFKIDIASHSITFNEQEIVLTNKELKILTYLSLNKNRVLTRLQLAEHVWGSVIEEDSDSNYIDVHIKNLRKKLNQHAPSDWLETIRGVGYKINTSKF